MRSAKLLQLKPKTTNPPTITHLFHHLFQDTAYLSSCLLLLITFGAMVGSYFYERRIWCRHLCPIGGMNGLYDARPDPMVLPLGS